MYALPSLFRQRRAASAMLTLSLLASQAAAVIPASAATPGCINIFVTARTSSGQTMTPTPQFTYRINNQLPIQNDGSGRAKYINLQPGQYMITQATPAGWSARSNPENNIVTVRSGTTCSTITFTNTQTVTSTQKADVSITKAATPTIVRGNNITYTLTAKNTGTIAAQNVTITDNLPIGVTYVDSASDATCNAVNAGSVQCNLGTLNAGATRTINLVVNVPLSSSCSVVNIYNTASIGTTTADSNASNNYSNTASTRVDCPTQQLGCIDIVNEAYNLQGAPVSPVPSFTYHLNNQNPIANDSTGRAKYTNLQPGQYQITQTLPSGWTNLSVNPSTSRVTVVSGSACARITFQNKNMTQPGGVDVTVSKAAPTTAVRGNSYAYTLIAKNNGTLSASNVVVTDTLPSGARYIDASSDASCNLVSGVVTCSLGTLAAGQTRNITVTVDTPTTLACNTVLTNSAQIRTSSTETNSSNNSSNVVSTQITCSTPQVGCIDIVTETYNSQGAPITPVRAFTYRTANQTPVQNNSLGQAKFTNLTPGQYTVTQDTPADWSAHSIPENNIVTVTAGTACAKIIFQNTQKAAPTMADVTITKAGPASVLRGQNVTYTLTARNNGTGTAGGVFTYDTLPAGLTYQDGLSSGNCNMENGAVKCLIGTLNAGATATVQIVATANTTNPCLTTVTNAANITTTSAESNTGNNVSNVVSTQITCQTSSSSSSASPCSPIVNVPGNLIQNPSVETAGTDGNPSSWSKGGFGTNNAVLTYPVQGVDGCKGVTVAITTYTDGDAKWVFNDVPVTPGVLYSFTDKFKGSGPNAVVVQFRSTTGAFSYAQIGTPTATANWQTFTGTFTPPAGTASVTVFHTLQGIGSLTTDAYALTAQSNPTCTQQPTIVPGNLIGNPSVETDAGNGTPSSWTKGGFGTNNAVLSYPVTGIDGCKAVDVTITSFTDGDAKWVFNEVPVTAGKTYVYSDRFKGSGPNAVVAQYRNAAGVFSYAQLGTPVASSSWQTFTGTFTAPAGTVGVTVFHTLQGIGSLTTDGFVLREDTPNPGDTFDRGYVTLTFDDGWMSHYTNVRPILNNAGLKASFFVMSTEMLNSAGDTSNLSSYTNTQQTRQLQTDGHEVSAHTRTHASLISLTPAQRQSEIQGSRQDLLAAGFAPVDTFVYPYGDYNSTVIADVQSAGFIGARTVEQGYNTRSTPKYQLKTQNVLNTTSSAQIKSWIDTAVANKTWLTLTIHQVDGSNDEYGTSPAILQEVVNYLKQNNIPVITMKQGLDMMP